MEERARMLIRRKWTVNAKAVWGLVALLCFGALSLHAFEYSQRTYKMDKDRVLHASKRIFDRTDREEFRVFSRRNSVIAKRAKYESWLLTMQLKTDEFNLTTVQDYNGTTVAKFSVSRAYGVDEEDRKYLSADDYIHDFFWGRMNYLLGLNDHWPNCAEYRLNMQFDGYFCDLIDLKNEMVDSEDVIESDQSQKSTFGNLDLILKVTPDSESNNTSDSAARGPGYPQGRDTFGAPGEEIVHGQIIDVPVDAGIVGEGRMGSRQNRVLEQNATQKPKQQKADVNRTVGVSDRQPNITPPPSVEWIDLEPESGGRTSP